ncbi:MAG: 1,4-dihydroxy-2-naphthoate polyprenyltransferase [Bacteroidota bacterium]
MPDSTTATLSPVRLWTLAARPKTLWAAVAPVVLGGALAWEAGVFHPLAWGCAFLGAIFIQIGTNFANDYHDFLLGADTERRVGPTRVTQAGLATPQAVRRAAFLMFALATLAGTYIMVRGGWPIVAVGVASLACGWLYTAGRKSLAYLGIADLFVFVFFGPVAVGGTYFVQAADIVGGSALPLVVVLAGVGPGLLSTAILLANNLRDLTTDAAAGKRTLVVRLGRRAGVAMYAAWVGIAVLWPLVLVFGFGAPTGALLGCLALPLVIGPLQTLRQTEDPATIAPVLGQTARALLVYSVLLAVGWNL